MSQPSSWPIPNGSTRFVLPRRTVTELSKHPISKDLYPIAMGYYKRAFGHSMSRSRHDDCLLIYCVDGCGKLNAGLKSYKITTGDFILLPKDEIHSYLADNKTPWSIYWLHCEGQLIDEFITPLKKLSRHPVLQLGLHSRLISDFEALLDLRQSTQLFESYLHSSSLLRQLLTHITLLHTQARHHFDKTFDMDAIQSLMLRCVHETLDIDTLAATANLSKFHFIKRYKALTGSTPINDFIRMKIERACHLLDITDQRISEIAWTLGYEDAYYFSRAFRNVMGISPSQYRSIRLGKATYKE